ncbi:MAG: hypothetical protein DHS20C18_22180 [Saprospiraceae bacterium]|nr:MAG: hypothetical protein DHS20C18_22180 [Saprospiraceae bacterium]
MSNNKYLIVVGGPTASGKTALAIRLAQYFQTEIISGDSRQFYSDMYIGTARPTDEELSEAKHHFIGHLDIDDNYSVGDFVRDALQKLEELFAKQEVVILVGGSGLYIRALCEGLDEFPDVPPEVKLALEQLYQQEGLSVLQNELLARDPEYYQEVDLANPHRIIRALSVCRSSGKPFSSFRHKTDATRFFTPIYLQLYWPREQLYERINQRVDQMMAQGLLAEAEGLFARRHLNALQTVGYQELFDYLEGKQSLEEAIELIKRNSRRYAKRQLTWMRKKGQWKLFRPEDWSIVLEYIEICRQSGLRIRKAESGETRIKTLQFLIKDVEILNVHVIKTGKREFFLPQYPIQLAEPTLAILLHELGLRCQEGSISLLAPPDWVSALNELGLIPEKAVAISTLVSKYSHGVDLTEWTLLAPKS